MIYIYSNIANEKYILILFNYSFIELKINIVYFTIFKLINVSIQTIAIIM
jgi:hypothetical protein